PFSPIPSCRRPIARAAGGSVSRRRRAFWSLSSWAETPARSVSTVSDRYRRVRATRRYRCPGSPARTAGIPAHAAAALIETDQHLARIGTGEDPQERGRSLFEPVIDRFPGPQGSVGQPGGRLGDVLPEERKVAVHQHAPQSDLLGGGEVQIRARLGRTAVVTADGADERDAAARAHGSHCRLQMITPDTVEVDI